MNPVKINNDKKMRISLDITKSIEESASLYYEKAKKAKKKLAGAKEALEKSLKRLEELKKRKVELKEKKKIERKKEWYEKFRWFYSSEGFLCIGGRDATSNEIVIKKHTEKDDLVFHTDMAGSPFFVIKNGQKAGEKTLQEAAQATASYSKAWKLGLGTTTVYGIKTEQVKKEFGLPKGSFMIHGKRNYFEPVLEVAVGILKDGRIMAGSIKAVKKNCEKFVIIKQGREKTSAVAKKIQKKIGGELDEIIRTLPAGGCAIKK